MHDANFAFTLFLFGITSVAGHSIIVIIFIPLGDIEIVLLSLQMVFYFAMHIHMEYLILCQ